MLEVCEISGVTSWSVGPVPPLPPAVHAALALTSLRQHECYLLRHYCSTLSTGSSAGSFFAVVYTIY